MPKHRLLLPAALLVGMLLLVSLLPALLSPAPASAITVIRTIDTTLGDFSRGTFQRTALVDPGTVAPNANLDTIDGTVQLAQVGKLRELGSAFILPEQLRNFGAVSIGNRIYVFGGERPTEDGNTVEPIANVWSAAVNLQPGPDGRIPSGTELIRTIETTETTGWRIEPNLPNASSVELGSVISRTHSFGIAAVDNPTGNDFIYLIGGEERIGLETRNSSDAVRIAVVEGAADGVAGTGGRILRWITSDGTNNNMRIPGTGRIGTIKPVVTTLKVDDTTYLYVFGGLGFAQRNPSGTRARGEVYYARIGSDGRLYRPRTTSISDSDLGWTKLTDIPGSDPDANRGLYEAALVKSSSVLTPTDQTILLFGGVRQFPTQGDPEPSAEIFQADVQPNGTIAWRGDAGLGGNLPFSLRGHAAVEYNGSLFLSGGEQVANAPTTNILASYLEDDLTIHRFRSGPSDPGTTFLVPDEEERSFNAPRSFHQSLTLQSFGSTIIYVMGGFGGPQSPPNDRLASSTVYSQRVVSETLLNPTFVNRGWYVSRPVDIELGAPKIVGISWNVFAERGGAVTDVRVEYRTSSRSCADADWTEDSWIIADGFEDNSLFSRNGLNNYTVPEAQQATARCFQYRAELTTESDELSPQLRELGITIDSDSSADLQLDQLSYNTQTGQLTTRILNLYIPDEDLTENAAADAITSPEIGERPVYLDLFIIGTGYNSTWVTPTLPLSTTTYTHSTGILTSHAYAVLPLNDPGLNARQTRAVPTSAWVRHSDNEPIGNFDALFDEGEYRICVAVDSFITPEVYNDPVQPSRRQFGNVTETLEGAEANNVTCSDPFTITRQPPEVALGPTIELGSSRVITEGTSTSALRISREALSVVTPLTVSLTLTGTAQAGTDYDLFTLDAQGNINPVTNRVIIPAGASEIEITVDALDNEAVDGDRTLTVALTTPSGTPPPYTVDGNNRTITLTIVDNDEPEPNPTVYLPLIVRVALE
ncbi:MAG: hypothetical protein HC911_02435 [Chloroflexaceae bacterium]|nr:hypothetical protein [Chloroflexaceae bacterium]